jgi:hypothetical protein
MRFRLGFALGFGAGYVLGAKAGRNRYEQIRARWGQLTGSPAVQKATERTKEVAEESARRGLTVVQQQVQKAGSAVKERLHRDQPQTEAGI